MPEVTQEVVVAAPLTQTWSFISNTANWAPMMPGFRDMTEHSPTNSEWRVQGDVGILSRLVTLDVRVTEWIDQDHVNFDLACREEPLRGSGSLRAAADGDAATRLTFHLQAQAGGMLAPAVNALLGKVLPGMANQFAGSIKQAIEASAAVRPV